MPRKTIYVREADEIMWNQAEKIAQKSGESLAGVVAAALRRYIQQNKVGAIPGTSSTAFATNLDARQRAAIKQMEAGLAEFKRGAKEKP